MKRNYQGKADPTIVRTLNDIWEAIGELKSSQASSASQTSNQFAKQTEAINKAVSLLGALGQPFINNDGSTSSDSEVVGVGTGNGSVTSVDVSGGATGLIASGGPITEAGTIALGGTLNETHGGTNQTSYAKGDILYSSASDALSKLAGNITTTRKFLRQTGDGSASAAPAWDTLQAGDLPTGIDAAKIGGGAVSNTEFSYLDGVTSAIQTQIDSKQASLGYTAEDSANKDTDSTFAANSDTKYASQKAVKTALDAKQQVLVAGWTTGIAASTTLYYWPGMSLSGSGTETARQTRMPACTLIGIRIHVGGAQSGTGALVITVRVNGAASTITKTIPAGTAANTDFDDIAHTVTLADGDKVSIEAVQGLGTSAANVTITLVYK